MSKLLGIALLTAGVIVAASAGIQLGESEYDATVAEGRAVLADGQLTEGTSPVPAETRLGDWLDAAGWQFVMGLLLLSAGAFASRVAIRRDTEAQTTAEGRNFSEMLVALDEAVGRIIERQNDEPLEETRSQIETVLETLVLPMIDARGALQHQFGLGGSALVLGPLSGAERQLNRAWSALVDGHALEGQSSLTAARQQVVVARQAMDELDRDLPANPSRQG